MRGCLTYPEAIIISALQGVTELFPFPASGTRIRTADERLG
jgi:hypothetical protein